MSRQWWLSLPILLVPMQAGFSQDAVGELKKAVQQTAEVAARSLAEQLPATAPAPCVDLDVLMGCVAFDEKGELRPKKEGGEPEVLRAGTIGAQLAAKLNEEREKLPGGASSGAAGADFLLTGLAGEDKIEAIEQFRLQLAADGSKSRLQNGNQVPRIVGTTVSQRGTANSVQFDNMGMLISGSAQIAKTGTIALAVEIERSAIGPDEEGTPISLVEGNVIRTPQINTLVVNTQVTVADGRPVLLGSFVRSLGGKVTETFLVVTATVVKP